MKPVLIISLALQIISLTAPPAKVRVVNLRCESVVSPLFIDDLQPYLSWMLESDDRNKSQSAYEIVVDVDLENVKHGKGSLWMAKVNSSESINIKYEGKTLRPFTRYYWAVRVYDEQKNSSEWSEPAYFETAMLQQEDWTAKWISDASTAPPSDEQAFLQDRMPLFRKQFNVGKKVVSARLYVSGLGYFEAFLNGKKVGDNRLDPGWTSYGKEVLYVVHDVTALIKQGNNIGGISLGNGWWNPLPIKLFGRWDLRDYQQTGRPCVKAELHLNYSDGNIEVISTDRSWKTAPGPVIRNSVYLGEWYDARLEQKNWNKEGALSKEWTDAREVAGPSGKMVSQKQSPVKLTKTLKPTRILNAGKDTFLVDMGQNFAGVARIRVKGPKGTRINLRYGENILADGRLNYHTSVMTQIREGGISGGPGAPPTAWQEDSYILKGEGVEEWSPKFTFHGFRYVEITGWPGRPTVNDVDGLRLNADFSQAGVFSSSNEMLNRIQKAVEWTFLSNVFSVQSDCPAREKLGYGADIVVTADAFLYNFDMTNFYRKAVSDLVNDQQPDGAITETAPFVGIADRGYGGFSGPLGWQLSFTYLQKKLWEFYGDRRIIEDNYDALVKQMDFLQSKAYEGLFHWDIGDHEALDPRAEAFSASAFYYHHALLAEEFAGILGKKDDSVKYHNLVRDIKERIVKKYLVPRTGRFDNGTQAAQLFALWYDLSPEEDKTFEVLLKEFERHQWHVSGGIYSVKMMFDVLRERDRNDVAYRVATQKDFPGWGFMLESGATTLWETWQYPEKYPSQNHPMFGSISEWFYRSLLGINPGKPGFRNVMIKPQPAGDLLWAKGSYRSVYGDIVSDWKVNENSFTLTVSVPANTTAEVWIPATQSSTVSEHGKALIEQRNVRRTHSHVVVKIGSGVYTFLSDRYK